MLLPNRDIRFRTALKTISHLPKEQYQPKNKQRRPLLQPILGFDLYLKMIKKYKPNFSTLQIM